MIHNKKVAVIDMGTNTFHLVLARVEEGGFQIIERRRVAVKLGEGGISHGTIQPEAMERAVSSLKDFRQLLDEHQVNTTYAFATSAVRNADNQQEFLKRAKCEAGIDVQVIDGEAEAGLIYEGVRHGMALGKEKSLIMDIGGGSVEFIIANEEKVYWKKSFEIGAQRLLDRFHQSDIITDQEQHNLQNYLQIHLGALKKAVQKYQPKRLIGCSGSFDTYLDILHTHKGHKREAAKQPENIALADQQRICKEIISKGHKDRSAIPGMIALRVDMIVVASLLIDFVIDQYGIKEITVSPYALKEGALYEACCRYERRWVA